MPLLERHKFPSLQLREIWENFSGKGSYFSTKMFGDFHKLLSTL